MAPSSKLRLNEKFLRKPGRNFQKFLNTFASLKQGQNRTDQMVLSPEEHWPVNLLSLLLNLWPIQVLLSQDPPKMAETTATHFSCCQQIHWLTQNSGQPVEHILQDLWILKQGKLISQLSVLLTIPLEQKQESKTKGNNKQNKRSNNRSDLCSSLYTICGYTLLFLLWLLIEFPCRVLVLKPLSFTLGVIDKTTKPSCGTELGSLVVFLELQTSKQLYNPQHLLTKKAIQLEVKIWLLTYLQHHPIKCIVK